MFEIHDESWYTTKDNLYFEDIFEYKTIRTNKQITYYNDILAFDIEASSFNEYEEEEYQDTSIYDYLLGTKIKITQAIYKDIPDFNDIRLSLFGRIYFSKSDGISIDNLYNDLMHIYPYYFPDDIYNPSDQLEHILGLFYQQSPEKQDKDTKRALMYVWQLAINGRCIIGRTWEEFISVINEITSYFELSSTKRMIIYVHNLAYEFQFMKDLFEWEKVFAISSRKPIYALTKTGIEFRCSYILSNLSLANLGESLNKYKVYKMVGDLDYEKVRHKETKLTKKEIRYCIHDVLVVSAFIKEAIEAENNDITRLPLTATGYCRRYVRNCCLGGEGKKARQDQFKRYHDAISHLTISGIPEYNLMRRAFAGGFTHTSSLISGRTLFDVDSYDLCSAYPAVMVYESGYPMSKGKKVNVTSYKEFKHYMSLYCCIFDVTFTNLRPLVINENYISVSKCYKEDYKPLSDKERQALNYVISNGRLVSGDKVSITITEVDFEIIEKMYDWDDIYIGEFYIYKRGRLPKEIVMAILKLYNDKTMLKGVEGKEDFYTKSKQLLNACYGMICTSIIQPLNIYDNKAGWTIEDKDPLSELKRYNKSKKRFLFYPWAIYITCFVRKIILDAINYGFGDDYCYSDTDSIKAINSEKHEWYIKQFNKTVEEKIKLTSEYYNIPFEMFAPKTIKGKVKMIGIFEKETEDGKWLAFKSLGAKRYMYLTYDRKLILTVSGINKKVATPYIIKKYGKYGSFKAFNEDLIIPAEYTGKLTHYYLDNPMSGDVMDYEGNTIEYESMSGVYMEKTSYSFSIESTYLSYLRSLQKGRYKNEVLQS